MLRDIFCTFWRAPLVGAVIYPLALTMPLPVLLYLITLEKEVGVVTSTPL